MATTTFHAFGRLPNELREMIWQHASGGDGYYNNGPARTIEVLLLPSSPHWIHPDDAKECEPPLSPLRFDFRLVEGSRTDESLETAKKAHPLSQATYHSREVFRRLNPNCLQLLDLGGLSRSGPLIRFNASRDKIFMDLETLFYLKEYASYVDTYIVTRPRLLCGFDRIQSLSRPLGSTLELARSMLRLLDGGPKIAEHSILPSVRRIHIYDEVAGSVIDVKTLSSRLYRTLNGLWHWTLSREQRDHIIRELERVQNLGEQPSLRPGDFRNLVRSKVPVEQELASGEQKHD